MSSILDGTGFLESATIKGSALVALWNAVVLALYAAAISYGVHVGQSVDYTFGL